MCETAWSTEAVGKMLENVFLFFNILSIAGVGSFAHFHRAIKLLTFQKSLAFFIYFLTLPAFCLSA